MHSTTVLPKYPRGSLKSSSSYAQELKALKKPEPALHEACKRFVENMVDPRITFFANLNHMAKRLAREKGYLIDGRGRVGYLLFLPKQPAVWYDEQGKQAWKIPIRASSTLSQKTSVFIARFDRSDMKLYVDDCWMYKGDSLITRSFSERWEYVLSFYTNDYCQEALFQPSLECGVYFPLSAFEELTVSQQWIHWMPEDSSQKRMRIQLTEEQPQAQQAQQPPQPQQSHPPITRPVAPSAPPLKPAATTAAPTAHQPSKKVLIARAVPHATLPDTFTLFTAENEEKGHAAVQQFSLSLKLKEAAKEGPLLVSVRWNSEFERWQILAIAQGYEKEAGPSSSTDFQTPTN
jgi:hypothetical protein